MSASAGDTPRPATVVVSRRVDNSEAPQFRRWLRRLRRQIRRAPGFLDYRPILGALFSTACSTGTSSGADAGSGAGGAGDSGAAAGGTGGTSGTGGSSGAETGGARPDGGKVGNGSGGAAGSGGADSGASGNGDGGGVEAARGRGLITISQVTASGRLHDQRWFYGVFECSNRNQHGGLHRERRLYRMHISHGYQRCFTV